MINKLISRKTLGGVLLIVALAAALQVVPAAWAAPEGAGARQTVPLTPVPTWTPVLLPAPAPDVVVWLATSDISFTSGSPFVTGFDIVEVAGDLTGSSSLRIKVDITIARFAADNGLGVVSADGSEIVFDAAALAQLDLSNLYLSLTFAETSAPVRAVAGSGGYTLVRHEVGHLGGLMSPEWDVLPGTEIHFEVIVVGSDGNETVYPLTLTLAGAVLPATGA